MFFFSFCPQFLFVIAEEKRHLETMSFEDDCKNPKLEQLKRAILEQYE